MRKDLRVYVKISSARCLRIRLRARCRRGQTGVRVPVWPCSAIDVFVVWQARRRMAEWCLE